MKRWYQKELLTVVFFEGEYQGCDETYTADCTQGAILMQRNCPGKAPQTNTLCMSGVNCEDTPLTKSVAAGARYMFSVDEVKGILLKTGTVQIKVIDAWNDDTGVFVGVTGAPTMPPPIFVNAAPEAGIIWAMFLTVLMSLAFSRQWS